MALGFYRDSSTEGWFFLMDTSLDENSCCTDGYRNPYSCLEKYLNYSDNGYNQPKLLAPSKLLTFNNETETEE